jgi:DNA-binding NarL/FixJ family response regulator
LIAAALQGLGIIAERSGTRAEAEAYDLEALELYRRLDRPEREAVSLFNLCSLAHKHEDYAAMRHMASEAVALGRATGSDYILSRALTAMGDALVACDQPVVAAQLLREALGLGRSLNSPHVVGLALMGLGEAALACAELSGARELFLGAMSTFRSAANVPRMIEAVESVGRLAAREGDFVRAVVLIAAASAARRHIHAVLPPRLARLLADVQLSCVSSLGQASAAAQSAAGAALSIDEACDLALVAAASPALSARESEVAALVADGLTNSQIAERLVIGTRTVQTHVSHVLLKLGFASRSQIAGWVARNTVRQLADSTPASARLG